MSWRAFTAGFVTASIALPVGAILHRAYESMQSDPSDVSVGRRCSVGCQSWPDSPKYGICPECKQATKRFRGLEPITESEAQSIVNHIRFNELFPEDDA